MDQSPEIEVIPEEADEYIDEDQLSLKSFQQSDSDEKNDLLTENKFLNEKY